MKRNSKPFVISVGGSLLNPGLPDANFLRAFLAVIKKCTGKGQRFILVAGGGKPARQYIDALTNVVRVSDDDMDWMGIAATRLNARLLQLALGKLAHPAVVENFSKKTLFKAKVLVTGGWKPGRSTDYVAAYVAAQYGAETIVNLSNIDYAYTKDPRKYKDAKRIERISWTGFRKIVGSKWDPGANAPFDPVASKFAQQHKQRVIIARGTDLKNLEQILAGKKYKGTTIE